IGEFHVSPGMTVERINLYCGWVDASTADGIHGLPHEGEEIRVVTLPRSEAVDALFGRLNTTSIIMTLQWLETHREQLLTGWGWAATSGA
ncbi:MAG: ADP-ribose pyrophosphatase, partial [Gammaproteobacteria bacterium]|nr:ADP-ribose pyrophosphatase [Gammaproteobacteria bacterium]